MFDYKLNYINNNDNNVASSEIEKYMSHSDIYTPINDIFKEGCGKYTQKTLIKHINI